MIRYNKPNAPTSNRPTLSVTVRDGTTRSAAPTASSQTTKGQTLEQRRAHHAWTVSEAGFKAHDKDYVNDAKSAPALIMSSGLMQVLAYLESKDERHKLLAAHLRDWLHRTHGLPTDFKASMDHLLRSGPREFQAMTAEALAWLKWLRRMAEARKAAAENGAQPTTEDH